MNPSEIILAGAAGDLGGRILKALLARGASVRALVRTGVSKDDTDRLTRLGARIVRADEANVDALGVALEGAACVVSALNGLREVIVDRQGILLDAAVKAGVPRFISSDYSADFTKTTPGDNRNFDLRREFMARADQATIQVTSILNGAFLDMLGAEMPIIQSGIRRVLYWGSASAA
jgi:nucleoside-diphosphate-sugar epimerase